LIDWFAEEKLREKNTAVPKKEIKYAPHE